MARKHSLDEVLRTLSKKADCRINTTTRTVYVLTDLVWSKTLRKEVINPAKKFDLGNGSWGKIDYLRNYCGYTVCKVGEF